jgi:hypothetical protein
MKRTDYLEKRKQIQRECEEKLAALDKVFEMFGGTPVSSNGIVAPTRNRTEWSHEKSKRDTVRDAVNVLVVPEFKAKDVRSVLATNFPEQSAGIQDNQLSAILSKLAENEEIKLVRKKAGQMPAIYGKVS